MRTCAASSSRPWPRPLPSRSPWSASSTLMPSPRTRPARGGLLAAPAGHAGICSAVVGAGTARRDRHRDRAARVAAFVYACFYTGLDAVAGIGAGTAALAAPPGADLGPVVTPLFQTGDQLGHVGAVAFMVASAAAPVALAR